MIIQSTREATREELIQRIKELEKENEELRRLDRSRVIGNINAIKIEDLKDVLSPYYIPKSVIREKIEELENNRKMNIMARSSQIDILKELLGE